MLNLTPLYLKLKIFQQMVEKLKVQVLALGNELLWKIKSNQSKMPTFCKIWGKKKSNTSTSSFEEVFILYEIIFCNGSGIPICGFSYFPPLCLLLCYAQQSGKRRWEELAHILEIPTISSCKFMKRDKRVLMTNYFLSFWSLDIMCKTKSLTVKVHSISFKTQVT